MKNVLQLPGYRVCEYMLVLDPAEELPERINKVREEFQQNYKMNPVMGRPNIMLASFSQYAMLEERLINRLNMVAMGHYPFKVELKDYGSFPSHTIFINVVSKSPVQDLVKSIRTNTQALMKLHDDKKPYFAAEPTMNIAKKLQPWQYEKGWLEYSHKHFTGRFIAKEMLLLKRFEGDKNWQVARHFEFQNLPVTTRQGELF